MTNPSNASTLAGPPFVHTNLFGGRGEVRVWNLLRDAAEPFTAALSCELAADGHVGAHVQQEFPELIIGIAGDGEARVNGKPHALVAHAAIHLQLGAQLEIINHSQQEPLRYLIIKARA